METELEVQRTFKRAELTAFLCLLKKVTGPVKVHVDNKGIVDGLWKGERTCIDPKVCDADFCGQKMGRIAPSVSKEILVEAEPLKVHRSKKDKIEMSQYEKFVTEANVKADELAKEGAMLDEGLMAEARAKTVQQEVAEVCAALQYAASFHCLVKERKDCEELKPKPREKLIFRG